MSEQAWQAAIHHDGSAVYVGAWAEHRIGNTITVRLRTAKDTPIDRIYLRTIPDGEQVRLPMTRRDPDPAAVAAWWEVELPLIMPRTNYRFLIIADDAQWWYAGNGITHHNPTDATDFTILANYAAPDWVQQTVFYQIFPDRFADGDPTNNVRTNEYVLYDKPAVARAWDELPTKGSHEFFGGDLPGITQHLDYLHDLGVSALYLNPVFVANSNHKYDVIDYRHVDPHFGGDGALVALRRGLTERGMHYILDIVPNHTGSEHQWFVDALADPNAPSAGYYTIRKRPDDYESWLGVPSLPKLNYSSLALRAEMYEGANGIMRYWLQSPFGADGWRIDVANMLGRQGETQLGHKIGRAIRRAVKEVNPQAYMLGENFFDGTPHLQGEELDATMNYQGFSHPMMAWLRPGDAVMPNAPSWWYAFKLPTEALAAQWQAFRAAMPWQVATQQFNTLSTHDVPRIINVLDGDMARVRVATGLLFTYVGVPSVYYGDEIGMEGGHDPDNRRPMRWNEADWNHDLRNLYKTLIRLRRTSPALCGGGFQLLLAEGDTLAYQREAADDRIIVVARREGTDARDVLVAQASVADGTVFKEIIGGGRATVAGGALPIAATTQPDIQVWRQTS